MDKGMLYKIAVTQHGIYLNKFQIIKETTKQYKLYPIRDGVADGRERTLNKYMIGTVETHPLFNNGWTYWSDEPIRDAVVQELIKKVLTGLDAEAAQVLKNKQNFLEKVSAWEKENADED